MPGMDRFHAHPAATSAAARPPAARLEGAGRAGDAAPETPWRVARPLALLLLLALATSACGTAATAPTPAPSLAPSPTPDRHLVEPATLDQVYAGLRLAGIKIVPTTASSGAPGGEPRKRVNASFDGWPLVLSEYSSATALTSAGAVGKAAPGAGAPPFSFAGLNVLVAYGPTSAAAPVAPDARFTASAQRLQVALDGLLGPLAVSSVVALAPGGASPTP